MNIEIENISKRFGDFTALDNVSITIPKGEITALLGPSGCGKTTLLRIVAGLEKADSGVVRFFGEDSTNKEVKDRKVGFVFQHYALFRHMNVFENIAFGLRLRKVQEPEIRTEVSKMLDLVGLQGFEARKVTSMSGGQQQRVAIARALINHPRILLLDEPLGALDLKLRKEMQTELKRIQQSLDITFVYVTHDQEEALTMSDTIVVMNEGIIQQIGSPTDIYNEPKNAFIADFIGESNILPGIMIKDFLLKAAGVEFTCVDSGFKNGEHVDVVIRPEDIQLVEPAKGQITGTVKSVVFKGVHYEMVIEHAGYSWLVHSTSYEDAGTQVGMRIGPNEIHIMTHTERSPKSD